MKNSKIYSKLTWANLLSEVPEKFLNEFQEFKESIYGINHVRSYDKSTLLIIYLNFTKRIDLETLEALIKAGINVNHINIKG